MISMEDWVTIRTLKKRNSGLGSRRIAELMGISRNTVKSAIKSNEPPKYERKEKQNPDIIPFEIFINEGLFVRKLSKSRILEDIRSKGFKGSKSAFYRYCEKTKEPETRTFMPYETAPGVQAQFDWSPYTITLKNNLIKVYVFSYIHGFSRHRVYDASLSQTQGSVFEAMENAMVESGGVCQRVQTDNAAVFIKNASRNNLVWNERYLAFCGHYGFEPSRSLPAHPWSKGKVERPFDYLEEHFIKGNEFESFDDFLRKLKEFQQKVNERIHSATKQKPQDLFAREAPALGDLPQTRFVNIKEEVRKVTADCLISYDGSRYSVPYLFAVKEVWLKVSKGYFLEIYSSQNKLIAKHKLSMAKGEVIMLHEHYKNHSIERGNWERLSETFSELFPEYYWMVDKVKTQKRINPNYHLTKIIEFAKYYKKNDMQNAFIFCRNYNIYTAFFIRAYLEKNASAYDIKPLGIAGSKIIEDKNINIKRSLSYYKIIGG